MKNNESGPKSWLKHKIRKPDCLSYLFWYGLTPNIAKQNVRGVTSLASNRTIINLIESLFVHFIAQVVKYYAKCAFLTFVQRPKVQYFHSISTSHLLSHFIDFTTEWFRLKLSISTNGLEKWRRHYLNWTVILVKVEGHSSVLGFSADLHGQGPNKKLTVLLKEKCRSVKFRKTIQF